MSAHSIARALLGQGRSFSLIERNALYGVLVPSSQRTLKSMAQTAAIALLCGIALRFPLDMWWPETSPFMTFIPSVLFAALAGGAEVGLFVAVVSGVLAIVVFASARVQADPYLRYLVWVSSNSITILMAAAVRDLVQTLRSQQHVLEASQMRLRAALKDAMRRSQAIDGATPAAETLLPKLLRQTLSPYGLERFDLVMDDAEGLSLPLEPAISIGVALHELASHSLKYGALLQEGGRVRVDVRWSGERLATLTWTDVADAAAPLSRERGADLNALESTLMMCGMGAEISPSPQLVCALPIADAVRV